jgi:hypothetical protein
MTVTASSDDPSQAGRKDPSRTLPAFAIQFLSTLHLREYREHTTIPLLSILLKATNKMATTFKLAGLRCTYIRANQGNDASFHVFLPNGRNVDVCSKEGADEFVDAAGSYFISTNLNAQDVQMLPFAYTVMIAVSENASPEKIAAGFPESEFRTYIEHTRNTLDTLSIDRNWLCSGTVSLGHQMLLRVVACFSEHPLFLKIFLSNEGMEAVAKFYASRKKNDTLNQSVAESILMLVSRVFKALTQEGLSAEKVFGIIEKTGLLGQFIRCVRVDPEQLVVIVTSLQKCLQLVKKKLKSGTRTGDILDAVIAGEDGPISEKAKSSLVKLQSLARLSNNNDNSDNKSEFLKMCHHCDKVETLDGAKLMKCQQCKAAYYCSKHCQVADWKTHKKMCNKLNNGVVSRSACMTSQTTLWAFIKSNYFDIAKEVYKKTQEYNVPKKELLVEIDFYGDAPALRNEFKVWLTSAFFEGTSVADAPDWFHTDTDKKTVARYVRRNYEQVTSDDLLTVCRAGNGMVTFQNLCFPVASTGCELLSDEAVESIGREDYARMVACLGQLMTDEYFMAKRSGL